MNDHNTLVVVEVARRGKLVVGEPFFTPGSALLLDRHGLAGAGPGDLAVVRTGRGRARLERVLGPASSIEPVLEGLLVEHGLREPFEEYEPPEPSLDGRVDLRELMTFTIDPDTAKDFDDAISARREGDGIRVWIHIADVSWFVPAGSPLDRGAAVRALSTYVPGMVAPMLPHEIADDLCSLRPNEDRLTVTVEVGPDGETNFYRSVIRSAARLTYGQAESILAGREKAEPALAEALGLANDVSAELRRRRFARGALRIESPDTSFEFDGQGGVARAWKRVGAGRARADRGADDPRQRVGRGVPLEPPPRGAVPRARAPRSAVRLAAPRQARRPRDSDAARAGAPVAADRRRGRRRRGGARHRLRRLLGPRPQRVPLARPALAQAGALRPARTSATPASRAPRTATSRRRSAAIPDLVVHRALLRELGVSDDPPAGGSVRARRATAR